MHDAATLRSLDQLIEAGLVAPAQRDVLAPIADRYPVAIPPAFAGAITHPDDPMGRQFVPHPDEVLLSPGESRDPIEDDALSPLPGLVHRYPDRVLLKPLLVCPVYCRFCFRREHVGPDGGLLAEADLARAFDYIRARTELREVILTGGDPLMLSPRRLGGILDALETIPHIELLRIHTRLPTATPDRVTDALLATLDRNKPLFIVLHANRAEEFSAPAAHALRRLHRAGAVLLGQSVLLRGVNDSVEALEDLFRAMLRARVKPYYLHQLDPAPGTARFAVPERTGRALLATVRARATGLAWPTYVRDAGSAGKLPL